MTGVRSINPPGAPRTPRPAPRGLRLFPTAIGECGLAWSDSGVLAVQLPEETVELTRARLLVGLSLERTRLDLSAAEVPAMAVQAMQGVRALMDGERLHLQDVQLDLRGVPEFACRVYALTRAILPGHTRTYGDLASELGGLGLSRAVGQALGANPFAPVVPCHRVLAVGARSGGFSAHGGVRQKLRMLEIEGAHLSHGDTASLF